jgi:hypothetical protein
LRQVKAAQSIAQNNSQFIVHFAATIARSGLLSPLKSATAIDSAWAVAISFITLNPQTRYQALL